MLKQFALILMIFSLWVDRAAAEPHSPLAIECIQPLSFGRVETSTPGTIGWTSPQEFTERGGAHALDVKRTLAVFRLHGDPLASLVITLPSETVIRSDGNAEVPVTSLWTDVGPDPSLDRDGNLNVTVGGLARVSQDSRGTFSGSLIFEASYRDVLIGSSISANEPADKAGSVPAVPTSTQATQPALSTSQNQSRGMAEPNQRSRGDNSL